MGWNSKLLELQNKALRPMAVVVKGKCSRLCEEDWRSLEGALRLIRDERYEGNWIGEYGKLR